MARQGGGSVSFDFRRPFHNEARVVSFGDGFVDLAFDQEEFPYEIIDGQLLFKLEDGTTFGSANILKFDNAKREPTLMALRNYDFYLSWRTEAAELADGIVRLFASDTGFDPSRHGVKYEPQTHNRRIPVFPGRKWAGKAAQ